MINKVILGLMFGLVFAFSVNASSKKSIKSELETKLIVSDSWARKSTTRRGNSAAYLKIQNVSKEDVVITGASSNVARKIELHQTFTDEKGISRMQEIEKLVVPAGETIEMKPGGLHVMLIGLKRRLKADDVVEISLLTKGAVVKISANVM